MCFYNKETGTEVAIERQVFGSSEEEETRVEVTADLLQISQQQPLSPVVKWERYLPVRSLKVLLVEYDDSTRHIVSALLNNCSYEVTAVSNALQAWRILEDDNSCIDLVLTEVVMPVHTGTDLLCKIMSHETLKNIPVIMMSSHDSMVMVFKCLSNGAVYFLVKPIRKNELKNLWQHVWRRCNSSSGSGSESGIHNKKSVKTESTEGSDAPKLNPGTFENGWEHVNKVKEVDHQNEQIAGTGSQAGMCASEKAEESGKLEKDDEVNNSSDNSPVESKTPSSNPTRPREDGNYRSGDRNVLRHSGHSAFSKLQKKMWEVVLLMTVPFRK